MGLQPAALHVPDSTEAEMEALRRVCEQLGGFDDGIFLEWVDGFLTAVAAGPSLPSIQQWLPALCGDAFDRAFADPQDEAQARQALQSRATILARQLDPEALLERPDAMRLNPVMTEWSDEDRAQLARDEELSPDDVADMQTGADWALGFMAGIEAFPDLWVSPDDAEAIDDFDSLLCHVAALTLPPLAPEYLEHVSLSYPKGEPTRDELIGAACWAVQDLRLFWVDHAPRPPTRRVDAVPGRNDPCPCGSGRKFKKCHGAG